MTPAARAAAAIGILDEIGRGNAAEKVLTTWGRRSRFAGSGDRAAIRDIVFDVLRRRRSYGWLGGGDEGRRLILGRARHQGIEPASIFTGDHHAPAPLSEAERSGGRPLDNAPDAVRLDVQDWTLPLLRNALGETTEASLSAFRDRAEVFLRVNSLKTDRDAAIQALASESIAARHYPLSETALIVTEGARRIARSASYLDGLVELQDAASQAVSDAVALWAAGTEVLDFCAGGGGKSLALAGAGAVRVVAHDADPGRMRDLPERAKRAGAQIEIETAPHGRFPVVLCDAPCSGSGAWRRQPEAKWSITPQRLQDLTGTQDAILDAAQRYVSQDGILAYATCSLFLEENENRGSAFLERNTRWQSVLTRRIGPLDGGDGFFLECFERKVRD